MDQDFSMYLQDAMTFPDDPSLGLGDSGYLNGVEWEAGRSGRVGGRARGGERRAGARRVGLDTGIGGRGTQRRGGGRAGSGIRRGGGRGGGAAGPVMGRGGRGRGRPPMTPKDRLVRKEKEVQDCKMVCI